MRRALATRSHSRGHWVTTLLLAWSATTWAVSTHTPTRPSPTVVPQAGSRSEVAREGVALVHVIRIDGGINPAVADFVRESIQAAHQAGAAALLIELDTPGGLLESTKDIVKDLLGAPLPVIVYVSPSGAGAASAGVFVTMAANIAAMAPGTNIGAAHPVGGGGENIEGDMRTKVENFVASLSKSIAQERGRNVEWAEKAVRESVSITEQEALKLNVIDVVAASREDLMRQIHGREVRVQQRAQRLQLENVAFVQREMRFKQKLLNVLANPNVAYLLMMAGLLGLYVEFTHPGLFFPGVAGAICLLLGFAALQVLPINYSGLALIVLGIALLIAELFLPSFGTLGVGGLIAFVLGSLLLFDTAESDLTLNPAIVYAAAATLGAFTFVVGYLVMRTQRRRAALGREGLIGEIGEVREAIEPGRPGRVFVHGEYWTASADEPLPTGTAVEVVDVQGLRLRVRRSTNQKM
ncbi:MAG: nodulation protein NfeD [Candidatus Binatia bacterium]|nr:nodulation protein NfeD [Candidatus Binatia bacterium]